MEVLVALVVLEIGLLGVAGLGLRAVELLAEASRRSRAAAAVEEVVDSLAAEGVRDDGVRRFGEVIVAWGREAGPGESEQWTPPSLETVYVVARDASGDSLFTTRAILPAP